MPTLSARSCSGSRSDTSASEPGARRVDVDADAGGTGLVVIALQGLLGGAHPEVRLAPGATW